MNDGFDKVIPLLFTNVESEVILPRVSRMREDRLPYSCKIKSKYCIILSSYHEHVHKTESNKTSINLYYIIWQLFCHLHYPDDSCMSPVTKY